MVSRSNTSSSAPSIRRTVCTSWVKTAVSPYSWTRWLVDSHASTRKPSSRSHSAHISSYAARDSMRPGVSWNRKVASGWKCAKYDVGVARREGVDQRLGEGQRES